MSAASWGVAQDFENTRGLRRGSDDWNCWQRLLHFGVKATVRRTHSDHMTVFAPGADDRARIELVLVFEDHQVDAQALLTRVSERLTRGIDAAPTCNDQPWRRSDVRREALALVRVGGRHAFRRWHQIHHASHMNHYNI